MFLPSDALPEEIVWLHKLPLTEVQYAYIASAQDTLKSSLAYLSQQSNRTPRTSEEMARESAHHPFKNDVRLSVLQKLSVSPSKMDKIPDKTATLVEEKVTKPDPPGYLVGSVNTLYYPETPKKEKFPTKVI